MARRSSLIEDLILCPWWVSATLAAFAYAGLRFAAPTWALMISLALLCIAAFSALRTWRNGRMLEGQTGLQSLRDLPWKRFEDLVAEVYRRQGYSVQETLSGGADGGVDLVLRRNGETSLVQCKRWSGKPVPVQTVRELYGVLTDRRAASAKLIATTSFTQDAVAFARNKPIQLVGANALLCLLRGVQTSGKMAKSKARSETPNEATLACPQCQSEMVLREAKRGPNAGSKFWGCTRYSACCRGTRPIAV
jgi:restriction system protein